MSKLNEWLKKQQEVDLFRQSIKAEDLTAEIGEIVKQLEGAGTLFKMVCESGIDPATITTDPKIQAVVSMFAAPPVKRIELTVENVTTFLGGEKKTRSEIMEQFRYSSSNPVKEFFEQNEAHFLSEKKDPTKKLSSIVYSLRPQVAGKGGDKKKK